MRKIFVLLALAVVLVSCDNGDGMENSETANPFVGTWESSQGDGARFVFTKTYATALNLDGVVWWKGSYTYDTVPIEEYAYDGNMYVTTDYKNPGNNDPRQPLVWPYRLIDSNTIGFAIYILQRVPR